MPTNAHIRDATNPTDLIGRPISVGDFVAVATMSYKSSAMHVGRIDKINFRRKIDGEYAPCMQHAAEKYTITIELYQSTGYTSRRTTTLQNVSHIVKLETPSWGMVDKLVNP